MPVHDTAALVVRAKRGDAAAFTELVRRFLRAAYSLALSIVGRRADAEDVAQEAFVVALERIDTCQEPDRFAGWLLQIVRNRARNFVDKRRLRDVTEDGERPDQAVDSPELELARREASLLAALADLPSTQRDVVLLHDLEEWTHAEIANALGLSEVNSRQHLFQARRALRAKLSGAITKGDDDERP